MKKSTRFRSKFEETVAKSLESKGISFSYESSTFAYKVDESRKYTPDFTIVTKNKRMIFVETKGRLTTADRKKMKLIKEQHPNLDIRILFQRDNFLYKGSKTKYSQWAESVGYIWAVGKEVPKAWLTK